jgi:tripartite-type tricarboxylate transporter receptor subunit TctC
MADPTIVKRLQEIGPEPVVSKSPEEFAAFMKDETDKWTKLVKDIGVATE